MISFLQPLALLGLAIAAIPPLIHLFARQVPPVVTFPALRYLTETERRQSRKLKLRNLLLMLLRTLLIALIALAASRPVTRAPVGSGHEPSAVGLVLDNSLSSGAVVGGRRVLDDLAGAARRVIDRLTPDDRLWLVLADGIPRQLPAGEARAVLDTVSPQAVHLELGAAARILAETMAPEALPGREVVIISDLQASAVTPGEPVDARVLVLEAPALPSENRSVDSANAVPPVWSPAGQVVAAIGGTGRTPSTVQLMVDDAVLSRGFGGSGDVVVLDGAPAPGWHRLRVALDPDEFRADDFWRLAVLSAPPAAVTVRTGAGGFVAQAVGVLRAGGRVAEGTDVVLTDEPGSGAVVLFPPDDAALLGAVNRQLEQRGVVWRFGGVVEGEWTLGPPLVADSQAVVRRRRTLQGSGTVLAALEGDPWIVRDGDLILVGSRLEPGWTSLPLSAAFVPFVDALVNRMAARETAIVRATPGEPVEFPSAVAGLLGGDGSVRPLSEGLGLAPRDAGVYFLRGLRGDTVGALEVNHDPRESVLVPASRGALDAAFGDDVWVLDETGMDRELFQGARRADLTGPFLLLALVLAVIELVLATMGGGKQTIEE